MPKCGLTLPPEADPATQKLFRAFVREGRIVTMPARYAKRRTLLDHVARLFEPGVRFPEKAVNQTLLQVYDDHAELRRLLVDEEFLTREDGVYWRSGGAVI
ncbi:DUF2087 domain-containing protein [Actinopolymorpha alba]|uniref:DUF2087 domain-containing protein n=1 Tax=Actinopolymorpha alba TaxID=533267 RepID=UPI00036D144C|nr:DUF2087 domain-containing protein [Actinopolymorpha alba]